jgi:hypothetical protein
LAEDRVGPPLEPLRESWVRSPPPTFPERFARGVVGAFRNPTAHDAKIEFSLTEEDALDMLATISMVHRRLDDATITPAAPGYATLRARGS